MKRVDRHHILWYHSEYDRGWAKRLRDHWYLKVEIPKDTLHRQIHHEVVHIPVPRAISIKAALDQLEMLNKFGGISGEDSLEKRLLVLLAIFECIEPNTYNALKKQYDVVYRFYNKKAPP